MTVPMQVSLSFVDPQTGWALATYPSSSNFSVGELFATTDAGGTWQRSQAPSGGRVTFGSKSNGVIVGGPAGSDVHVTSNGGKVWRRASVARDPGRVVYAAAAVAGGRALVIGAAPASNSAERRIVAVGSDDGGTTWREEGGADVPVSDGSDLASAVGQKGDVWLAASPDGKQVWRGTKSGTVAIETSGLSAGVVELSLAGSGQVAWALSQVGGCSDTKTACSVTRTLSASSDGGTTWRAVRPE